MRGAGHATLERRLMMDGDKMRELVRAEQGGHEPALEGGRPGERPPLLGHRTSRGLAQAMMLFGAEDQPPPKFTFHEFSLTDAVGHDYGPHHDGHASTR